MSYEYLVVPAPRRAPRIKGVRNPADRFAMAVAEVMNEAGREGWEYLRTDTLPMEARGGWFGGWFSGGAVTPQELLVFRRALDAQARADVTLAPAPAFSRNTPRDRDAAGEVPRPKAAAVTPLAPRPAPQSPVAPPQPVPMRAPAEPPVSLEAQRDALEASLGPRPDPDGTGPGRPRLGGARRD